jgi:hypothetical protein
VGGRFPIIYVTNDVIELFPYHSSSIFSSFYLCVEREKQFLTKGDEPTVHQQSRRSLNSQTDANTLSEGINSLKIKSSVNNNDNVQLPCVGRWGCEWPS